MRVDVDFDAITGCSSTNHRADALGSAATAANYSPKVSRTNLDFELDSPLGLHFLDLHGVGIVNN